MVEYSTYDSSPISTADTQSETSVRNYNVVSMLGQGGCGTVVKIQKENGTFTALKIVPEASAQDRITAEILLVTLENEARMLARLNDLNMSGVPLYHKGVHRA